jgi:hypothetical protein
MTEGAAGVTISLCPACKEGIRPEHRLRLGQRFFCPECCTEMEAVSARLVGTDGTCAKDKLAGSPTDSGHGEAGSSVIHQRR